MPDKELFEITIAKCVCEPYSKRASYNRSHHDLVIDCPEQTGQNAIQVNGTPKGRKCYSWGIV